MRRRTAMLLVAGLTLGPLAASRLAAAEAAPDAATLLFDENQLAATPAGTTLVYKYRRKAADEAKLGPSFDDTVRVVLSKGSTTDNRTVEMQLFSGPRRLPTGTFADMTGNPVLSIFLEHHVKLLAERLQANPRYLKNAIRAALRDRATVTPATLQAPAGSAEGWRVRVEPFRDDPNKARMAGLEGLTYEFSVARSVPGEVVAIRVQAIAPQGTPLLEETIDYDSEVD